MAIFTTNQVRHLYVGDTFKTTKLSASDTLNTVGLGQDKEGCTYIQYMGVNGLMRSDLIDPAQLLSFKATKADDMARATKGYVITLDTNVGIIPGQDYILRIAFDHYIGMSDEDTYYKYGIVHAYTGMDAATFYAKMIESLVMNFSREVVKLVKIGAKTSSGVTWIDSIHDIDKVKEATGIYIYENIQDELITKKDPEPVYFTVTSDSVILNGDEVKWGNVSKDNSKAETVKNGGAIADLEYFCMGSRGDIYRNVGWPDVIVTKYQVDPTKEYDVLDIHYAYVGANENIQKSEKTLTIVCDKTKRADFNTFITAIAEKLGVTVASTPLK